MLVTCSSFSCSSLSSSSPSSRTYTCQNPRHGWTADSIFQSNQSIKAIPLRKQRDVGSGEGREREKREQSRAEEGRTGQRKEELRAEKGRGGQRTEELRAEEGRGGQEERRGGQENLAGEREMVVETGEIGEPVGGWGCGRNRGRSWRHGG
eukprot:766000-Hanusia_phi.AAC.1